MFVRYKARFGIFNATECDLSGGFRLQRSLPKEVSRREQCRSHVHGCPTLSATPDASQARPSAKMMVLVLEGGGAVSLTAQLS